MLKRHRHFLLFSSCLLILTASSGARAERITDVGYWNTFDQLASEKGAKFMTDAEAEVRVEALAGDASNEEARALGKLIEAAKKDDKFALKLQTIIAQVRNGGGGDVGIDGYKYAFVVDGEFGKRSVSEIIRLYGDEKTKAALKNALKGSDLELNAATIAKADSSLLVSTVSGINTAATSGTKPPNTDCPTGTPSAEDIAKRIPSAEPPPPVTKEEILKGVAGVTGPTGQQVQKQMSGPALTPSSKDEHAPAAKVPSPKDLIAAAADGLKLKSKAEFKGTVADCTYENSKVTVVLENCGSKNLQNRRFKIVSKEGGEVTFSLSARSTAKTEVDRSKYEMFSVISKQNGAECSVSGNPTVSGDPSMKSTCRSNPEMDSFYKNPPKEWARLLNKLDSLSKPKKRWRLF